MPISFQQAVDYITAKNVVLPDVYYGELANEARNRAFSIAGIASRTQLQGVLTSLNDSLAKGVTFADWKKLAVVQDLGLPGYRLNNIYRTNIQCAYNQGHWTQQQRNKATRPFLMYDAVNDSRTRPAHTALDNVIRPIDDPFWATHYPPNGYQCRCAVISLTEAQARARGGVTPTPPDGWLEPDKGWDYNPGAAPDTGVDQAMAPPPHVDPTLQHGMETAIARLTADTPRLPAATPAQVADWLTGGEGQGARGIIKFVGDQLQQVGFPEGVYSDPLHSIRVVDASDMGKTSGSYSINYKTIELNSGLPPKVASDVLLLEVGRHLDASVFTNYSSLKQALEVEHRRLEKTSINPFSTYTLSDHGLWVAEAFKIYVSAPQVLQLLVPETYNIFESVRSGQAFK